MNILQEDSMKLIEAYMEGINDKYLFKAVFLAGGPGSGKSFIGNKIFGGSGVKVLNSDEMFEFLLDKFNISKKINPDNPEQFDKQMKLRQKAKSLTNNKSFNIINGMLPIVVDGTGKDFNKIAKQARILRNIGYDTDMVFVNTSKEVALDRNAKRARSVPEDIVIRTWQDVQNNIGKFQGEFPGMTIVDNSESLDAKGIQKLEKRLARVGMKILNKPVKNPIGKKILKKVREVGGKLMSDVVNKSDINFKI